MQTKSRRSHVPAAVAAALALMAAAAFAQENAQFDLPAQSLVESLRAIGKRTDTNILIDRKLIGKRQAPALKAELSVDEALKRLLEGTGLKHQYVNEHTVTIVSEAEGQLPTAAAPRANAYTRLAQADVAGSSPISQSSSSDETSQSPEKRIELEEIIVTGTNIRGVYPSSSPVQIYTAEDIARTGATTTEQFIQKLPQNFGVRTQYAPGSVGTGTRLNNDAVVAPDLRGLGVGTTLVLMNGRRLGLSEFGRTADISLIPAAAIERVEVLTDGASAIYGSDAVGGVINFVLRRDFEGAETRASYGGVTSGGLRQRDFNQTFGHAWNSGHGLISFNYFSASELDVNDRSYSTAAQKGALTPDDKRQNALATFSQDLGERWTVSGDLAFARRDVTTRSPSVTTNPLNNSVGHTDNVTKQSFVNLGLDYRIAPAMNASLKASYSTAEADNTLVSERYNLTPPTFGAPTVWDRNNSVLDVTAMLDGTLFAMPAGDVRFSVGAGLLDDEAKGININVPVRGTLARRTSYAFGELFVPLVDPQRNIPLVSRLELTLAGRFTKYSDKSEPALDRDFGDDIDPKVGLLWQPVESLTLRGTYGTAFRAPFLIELDETTANNVLLGNVPVPAPSGPLGTRIQLAGVAVPDLRPETAKTYTLGFDLQFAGHRGFRLSATYYNISYTDRIAQAPRGGTAFLQTPSLFPDAIYAPPSIEFIERALSTSVNTVNTTDVDLTVLTPAQAAQLLFNKPNAWIVDLRLKNLALSEQDGVDLLVEERFETPWGALHAGANATRILSYQQKASAGSAEISAINGVTLPVDFRARIYAGLSRGSFDATLSANYVDDYASTTGSRIVESWTTADLSLSYAFGADRSGFLRGVRLNLSAQNIFDRDPPFVTVDPSFQTVGQPIGFDPTNANPLGRIVVLGFSKTW